MNFLRGRIRWYFQCRKTAKHFYKGKKKSLLLLLDISDQTFWETCGK